MRYRVVLPAIACLALQGCVNAAERELDLPSFTHLQSKAVESVDITIGSLPLSIARQVLKHDDDPDTATAREVLKGLTSVSVRNYRFKEDFVYSKADLDGVRAQLKGPGWSQLAQVRDNKQNEDVDVFVEMEQDKITSLAVIASKPREFTIVYVVGSIDPTQIGALQEQLNLPPTL
jgi:hypothetical protein